MNSLDGVYIFHVYFNSDKNSFQMVFRNLMYLMYLQLEFKKADWVKKN